MKTFQKNRKANYSSSKASMAPPASHPSANDNSRPKSLLEVPDSFFDGALVYYYGDIHGTSRSDVAVPSTQSPMLEVPSHQDTLTQGTMNRWACSTCGSLDFASLDDQRSHFKSDFHRLNVKHKLVGKEPISEEAFEVLAQGHNQRDDDISSISGSEEEDNDSSDEEKAHRTQSFTASKPASHNHISLLLQSSDEIATFWKCVVLRDNEKLSKDKADSTLGSGGFVTEDELLQRLKGFVASRGSEEKIVWVVLLSRGGHFAGCVFDAKKGSILAHKTHHRYVVRAKAGGKQSTKDATGRAPKSAGASLRRLNEASLQREIRDVLASWKGYLDAASRIFVHAPSRNSHAFFGGEDRPLNRSDDRVCQVPITTRRPTFKEAKRVYCELTTVSYKKLECMGVADAASSSKSSNKKLLEGLYVDGGSEELHGEDDNITQASPFCDGILPEEPSNLSTHVGAADAKEGNTSTSLHDAAKLGDVHLVLELLEKGANPCARDYRGQTPYTVAVDKETRNVFRKFMAEHLEIWDWHAANVPSALTDEMEAAQAAKQAEKEAKRKAKAKEQKKLRKEKQKARAQVESLQELAAAASKFVYNEKTADLEDSLKLKQSLSSSAFNDAVKKAEALEREKRASAAEKRILAMSSGLQTSSRNNVSTSSLDNVDSCCCSCCGVSLAGMTPFYRFSFQYCSTVCVQVHRLALESQ